MTVKKTGISWTDATWGPVRGCSRISTGCEHCYAESQAGRFSGPGQPYEGLVRKTSGGFRWTGQVHVIEKDLLEPLRWTRPRFIFVNSMSDLFHEELSLVDVARIFAVMGLCYVLDKGHTFQVLTKRAERMQALLTDARFVSTMTGWMKTMHPDLPGENAAPTWPLPNVWLGVSTENQATADTRIPCLLETPAVVRFVSAEPLLAPLDLAHVHDPAPAIPLGDITFHALSRKEGIALHRGVGLDWVIVGGESGPKARCCNVAWIRSLVRQCAVAQVPCWVKQLGTLCVAPEADFPGCGRWIRLPQGDLSGPLLHDRKGADPAEWPDDLRVQERPDLEVNHG